MEYQMANLNRVEDTRCLSLLWDKVAHLTHVITLCKSPGFGSFKLDLI